MTSEALLVDLGDSSLKPKVKGRSSFYSLPKTLSEDDDPFGVFQSSRQLRKSGQEEATAVCQDTNIGLLVQIEPESPRVSVSEYTRSSISGSESHLMGMSGGSMKDGSAMFGNISRVSMTTSTLSDDVFLQDCHSQSRDAAEQEPNWDKLLNEAQFVALKISEPASTATARTPLGLPRLNSAVKFSSYSPCEPILDISQEEEQFLVKLTPEKSPSKEKSEASPKLEGKKSLVEVENKTNSQDEQIVDMKVKEEPKKAPEILVEVYEKKVVKPVEECNKRNVTPLRKASKENIKPRVISRTDVKKVPVKQPIVARSKLGLRQPATEVKKPTSVIRKQQPEVKGPLSSLSRQVNTPAGTFSKIGRPGVGGVTAAKTLQFTPRSSGQEKRREVPGLFKEPRQAVESQLKKSTNRTLLKPPRPSGPLRPPTNAASKSWTQSSSSNSSGLPRSGLVRPALYRSGSGLVPSMLGGAQCPGGRRPSGLPSPQLLNKNASLVCSTPTLGGKKQSSGSILPSPINSVKRRV